MLYQDFDNKAADAVVAFVFGCLLCFAGVTLLTSGRVYVDDELDAQQLPDEQEQSVDLEASIAATECSAASSADERRAKRSSLKTVRHALRHLDSPLFRGAPRSLSRSVAQDGIARADSFDSLYENLGREAGVGSSLPESVRRLGRRPHDRVRVTDAPFGGGEHAMSFLHSSGRRALREGGHMPARAARSASERGALAPPLPTHRRSHSDGGKHGAGVAARHGMEAGLLEEAE